MSNLLNCPFCNEPPVFEKDRHGQPEYVYCDNGLCKARPMTDISICSVLHWNQRAPVSEWQPPEGWVLVPLEPTSGMRTAAREMDKYHNGTAAHAYIYKAMILAAPTPRRIGESDE